MAVCRTPSAHTAEPRPALQLARGGVLPAAVARRGEPVGDVGSARADIRAAGRRAAPPGRAARALAHQLLGRLGRRPGAARAPGGGDGGRWAVAAAWRQGAATGAGLPGAIEVADRQITDFGDPIRTTETLAAQEIPMTGGPCWRGSLVTTDGAPMFLSLAFSHLILDVWSMIELERRFRILVEDPEAGLDAGASQRDLSAAQHAEKWQSRQACGGEVLARRARRGAGRLPGQPCRRWAPARPSRASRRSCTRTGSPPRRRGGTAAGGHRAGRAARAGHRRARGARRDRGHRRQP